MSREIDALLDGPRGRRLCLELAMELEPSIRSAVFWLAYDLDPHSGSSRVMFTMTDGNDDDGEQPSPTIDELVRLLAAANLDRVDDGQVRLALRRSVSSARYWQEPDGEDILATDPLVRSALRPFADSALASTAADWWDDVSAPQQYLIRWENSPDTASAPSAPTSELLAEWGSAQLTEEERSQLDRPSDPRANWSGSWWSFPLRIPRTVARVPDAFDLVEDSLGWDEASVLPVRGGDRTLHIRHPDDWAALCRRFPFEVTASRRHDWYRTTGRDGRWVIPDWRLVAEHSDAVHLTVLGYLTGATRLLTVDDDTATVIGGWDPDCTLWLTEVTANAGASRETWRKGADESWTRAGQPRS